MTTYLAGTDGGAASEVIGDFLTEEADDGDHIDVVNVLTTDDVNDRHHGEEAIDQLAERFEDMEVTVTSHQLARGRKPAEELIEHAKDIEADHIVAALRRHSRTERIIFGSVSHSLLQRVDRPITLVPLPEYQPGDDTE